MKTKLFSLLAVFAIFWFTGSFAQQWMNTAQDEPVSDGASFFDIQKSFYDYWKPFHVDEGYYVQNGQKIKAGGWKQFKRWEWFWQSRVNPQTGEFPKTSAYKELRNYLQEHPQLKSTSGSTGNWTTMGPATSSGAYVALGRLNCVAFDPDDTDILYVGAASGGLWKTTDGGLNWTAMTDHVGALGVSDIVVLKDGSGTTLYLATGDRDANDTYSVGVLKSIDGGTTWDMTGLKWEQGSRIVINRMLVDPVDKYHLYAAASTGLYETSDGGTTWLNLTPIQFINIKFNPGDPLIMYGSTRYDGQIYRSVDGGHIWALILDTAGRRVELAVSPAATNIVYALICQTDYSLLGIYKSVDSGLSYTEVFGSTINMLGWDCSGNGAGGQGWYDLCMAVDPTNADVVFVGGVLNWKSIDGGTSWSSLCNTGVHVDQHGLAFQLGTNTLFECNDGGLYKTEDLGSTWGYIGHGLVTSQMYRLGVSQTSSAYVITGLQDNGSKALMEGTWKDVLGGDGMEPVIDYTNFNIQYAEYQNGHIYRTDNLWATSKAIYTGISGTAGWVTPYMLDPHNNNVMYVGYQDVWVSTIGKRINWKKLSNWAGQSLVSLAVAPSDSKYIYAGTYYKLYGSIDGGLTWLDRTSGLPVTSSNINYISVKSDDPKIIWASLGQYNGHGVYQSTDAGSTWTDISGGLPNLPVNCVIQNKLNTEQLELYAGTDVGVFLKLGDTNWVPFFDGLPNVVVSELEIYYAATAADSRIRAATYGRGLWESGLYSAAIENQAPTFTSDPIIEADASVGSIYSGSSLADNATDPNGPTGLKFYKVLGPDWLLVAENGALSGSPSEPGVFTSTVKVIDPDGLFDEATLNINVLSIKPPVVNFSANRQIITVGETVTFSDLSDPVPAARAWSLGDGIFSTDPNPSATYLHTGYFNVTLTATNAGGSGTLTRSMFIKVYCKPGLVNNSSNYIKSVAINGATSTTDKSGSGYSFYSSPVFNLPPGKSLPVILTPGNLSARYYWAIWVDYNGDGDFLDANEKALTINNKRGAATGSILIPGTASRNCMLRVVMNTGAIAGPCDINITGEVEDYTTTFITPSTIAGLNDDLITNKTDPVMNLYPNPANTLLNISTEGVSGEASVRLLNILGQQMDLLPVTSGLLQLDLARYPSGIYYVLLEDQNNRIVRKFIKE